MTSTSESTTTTQLKAGSWALDTAHSSVSFTVRHLGISRVRGGFTRFETEFVVDESGAATVDATIHLDSFDSGNAGRDEHMRAADFLDVANRPTLTFRTTKPVVAAQTFQVEGEVTIGTITKPVTLDVEWGGVEHFAPTDNRHAGFSATGTIKRSDFSVGPALPGLLSDAVRIELEIEVIEPK
ncbi:YceI family protein [Nocardia sp. R6R-6]|uniref:YceI family protein n=1 Tax=Nocardia sp. R6R-6 TaxID=3459303 RepID=UPI00403E22F1